MYQAYITRIQKIRKHENADRLQCAEVFGTTVVVDMNYTEGQRVVYFPADGQLSQEFAKSNNLLRKKDENGNNIGGYLDPNKRNITAIKLRGEKSDGLVLPVEVLAKYVDPNSLKDGEGFAALNGHEICRKYIPNQNRHQSSKPAVHKAQNRKETKRSVSYPYFEEHVDTEQLAYNQHEFHVGDTIYLTQKLHGTSFRVGNMVELRYRSWFYNKFIHTANTEYKVVSGTRRRVLRSFEEYNDKFRQKYFDLFTGVLPKGMTVYGEIVGWMDEDTPIMPKCNNSKLKDKEFSKRYGKETVFTYGCAPGENELYVYRITMVNEDGIVIELPTEEVIKWCQRFGVDFVPLLDKFLYTTWEDLNERCEKFLDVPEPLSNGTHVTEGVVVRIDNRSRFTAYKTKSFAFKVLEGIIKDTTETPDIEEAEETNGIL